MKPKTSQRTVYIVTAIIVASMISGFALATLSLGGTSVSYQGSHTTSVQALQGLTWQFTGLSEVNASTPAPPTCGAAGDPCNVYGTSYTVCAGNYPSTIFIVMPCNQGDFIEQVQLYTTAGENFTGGTSSATLSLTVFVTGTPYGGTSPATYAGAPIWFTESSPTAPPWVNSYETITLLFDIGSMPYGPGSVTSVSVLATTI